MKSEINSTIFKKEIKDFKLSIIIPHFGSPHILSDCLDSIKEQTLDPVEIIIINNQIGLNLSDLIQKYKKLKITIVSPQRNLFYSEAVNSAVDLSKNKKWFLFLNNDVYLPPNYIETLKKNNEKGGVLFSLVKNRDGKVDSMGVTLGIGARPLDTLFSDQQFIGPPGSCFAASFDVLELLKHKFSNYFNVDTNFYYTDLDFSFRLREISQKIFRIQGTSAIHHRSLSTPKKWLFFKSISSFLKLTLKYKRLLIQDRISFLKTWKGKLPNSYIWKTSIHAITVAYFIIYFFDKFLNCIRSRE